MRDGRWQWRFRYTRYGCCLGAMMIDAGAEGIHDDPAGGGACAGHFGDAESQA